ncbi:hypothetical protein PIB30_053486 [Stylosanthes scabra]|uniref:Uncharacterized protein n=1 Tax=Stylosanthes scabra TaxID=79078 RepID=A0ABU6YGT0_9FABA|nr:hypothetical protein [Stylosanthes scabra]
METISGDKVPPSGEDPPLNEVCGGVGINKLYNLKQLLKPTYPQTQCMPALKGVRKPLVTPVFVLRMKEVDVEGRVTTILNPTKLRDHPINLVPLDGPKVYKWDDRALEGSVFLLQNALV